MASAPEPGITAARELEEHLAALAGSDGPGRCHAIKALADMGPAAAPAAGALVASLQRQPAVAEEAARLPAPLRTAARQGGECPSAELEALAAIGPAALPPLLAALQDERGQVRAWAAQGVGLTAPPQDEQSVAALLTALEDRVAVARLAAGDGLQEVVGEPLRALLVKRLAHARPAARAAAAQALGVLGLRAAAAVPALVQALGDADAETRQHAAVALGEVGPEAADAGPALVRAVADEQPAVRRGAAWSLGRLGLEDAGVVSALVHALQDSDDQVRHAAAAGLGELGPGARSAVGALTRSLADRELLVRCAAAEALGGIGPQAEPAVPALIKSFADEPEDSAEPLRRAAVRGLGGIGPKAIPKLLVGLRAPDQRVREYSARAIGYMGAGAKATAPILKRLLSDRDAKVRTAAEQALVRVEARR